VVEQDLSIDRFKEILKSLPNLETVQFCGNYGDPVIAKNILESLELAKQYAKKIQIHTNGSLRSQDWWSNLASLLSNIDHDVWFGIDGTKGIHEIYRQGTDYDKIIDNATAFINNGGYATWQFIPYAHNEHQVRECFAISQKLKFKKFKIAKLYRKQTEARHWKTGELFELLPTTEFQSLLRMPKEITKVEVANCMHLSYPSMYLAANGKISRCCYLSNAEKFDNVESMFYNQVNLDNVICLNSCGT
jgi:sulfatase maturation enzyme AslB (radical SAM superfamily)